MATLLCAWLSGADGARAGPALVFDADSGHVLHAHQPFQRWYPASLTKLMTTYVAFQAVRERRMSLGSPVRMTARAAAEPPSKMGFPVGTEISLDHALRILMVRSANDIATAVAESVAGDHDRFIAKMNAAAARLGMSDTRFFNAHGLPDNRQVTTARDMGLLVRALIREFPEYQYFFALESIRVGSNVLTNHNRLMGSFAGANGMKTGYICSSGFNLAASATRNGRRVVAIVLGATNARYREQVAAGLLEAGFDARSGLGLFARGRPTLAELPRPSLVPEPVDMCPYVRQRRPLPAELASFGTEATARSAPVAAAAGMTPSLPDAGVLALAAPARRAEPVSATTSVPLPRPRPLATAGHGAVAAPAEPARRGLLLSLGERLRSPLQ